MATDSNSPWLTKMLALSILLFGAGTGAMVIFGDSTSEDPIASTEVVPVLSAEDQENFNRQLQAFEQTAPTGALAAMKADVSELPDQLATAQQEAATKAAEEAERIRQEKLAHTAAEEQARELQRQRIAEEARKEQERQAHAKALADKAATDRALAERQAAERLAAEKAAAAKVSAQMAAAEKARTAGPGLPPSLPPPKPAYLNQMSTKLSAPAAAEQRTEAPRAEPRTMWEFLPPAEEVEGAPSTAAIVGTQPGFQLSASPVQSASGAMPWAQRTVPAAAQFVPTLELAQGDTVWIRTTPSKTERVRMGDRHPTLGVLRSIRGEEAKFDNATIVPRPN